MSEKYDVVIIGAGIGGLVCGCYLAKAGLKVLIIEQHSKPGGYCTSFERKGFKFDVGVHYLGSLKRGILRKIFDELKIDLTVTQIDPCDKIIMPENIVYIRTDTNNTIQEFKKNFPKDSENIDSFFNFILNKDFLSVYRVAKRLTFLQVLDKFFKDYRIKSVFSLLLGNIGLSAKVAAAIPSIILFREYILDCGYYPIGGMQAFPDTLVKRFDYFGGKLFLSRKVTKIISENYQKKVLLNNGEEIIAKCVVSNADARTTFKELLDVSCKESHEVDRLIYSSSMFLVYLGLNLSLDKVLQEKANVWYFSTYKVDKIYSYMSKNVIKNTLECLLCSFPSLHDPTLESKNKSTAILFIHAPYKSKQFWEENKEKMADKMINKATEIIKGLPNFIDLKIYATPITFYKYTSNRDGAFVGWLSSLKQINSSLMPQKTSVDGLYTVGHWSSMGYPGYGGIPNVAFSGRRGAMLLLRDLGMEWSYKEISLE